MCLRMHDALCCMPAVDTWITSLLISLDMSCWNTERECIDNVLVRYCDSFSCKVYSPGSSLVVFVAWIWVSAPFCRYTALCEESLAVRWFSHWAHFLRSESECDCSPCPPSSSVTEHSYRQSRFGTQCDSQSTRRLSCYQFFMQSVLCSHHYYAVCKIIRQTVFFSFILLVNK